MKQNSIHDLKKKNKDKTIFLLKHGVWNETVVKSEPNSV